MNKKRNNTTVNLSYELRDKIKFMSQKQGKSQTQLLTEVINALFDSSSMFQESMLMLVDSNIAQCIFTFGGKSNLVFGSVPIEESSEQELDEKIHNEAKKRLFQEQEPEEHIEGEILKLSSKKRENK